MDISEKLAKIQSYDERGLREKVLMRLLVDMDYQDVRICHGSTEAGKDIVFWKEDELGDRIWTALVVKTTKITGKADDMNSSLFAVCNQVEQVFNEPYTNPRNTSKVRIDRCWVVTSSNITSAATQKAMYKFRKSNLDRVVKFLSGQDIVRLLDQYAPNFFEGKKPAARNLRRAFSHMGKILEPRFPGVRPVIESFGALACESGIDVLSEHLSSYLSSASAASGIPGPTMLKAWDEAIEANRDNFPPEEYDKLSGGVSQAEEDYDQGCQSSCQTDAGPFEVSLE